MTPEETLLAAANDMAEHGMCKGTFFAGPFSSGQSTAERQGAACAMGSIARVSNSLEDIAHNAATRKLAATIVNRIPSTPGLISYDVVSNYNDNPSTSAEDMILMMKEAAHE